MPAQSKYDMLEKINATLEASQGFYVVDYRGLTVKETQELRRSLREAGGVMKVFKNNIVKIALQQHDMPNIDDILVGTCSYVFFADDPVTPAKVLKDFAKKTKKTEVIGGIADGRSGQGLRRASDPRAAVRSDCRPYQRLCTRHRLLHQRDPRWSCSCYQGDQRGGRSAGGRISGFAHARPWGATHLAQTNIHACRMGIERI